MKFACLLALALSATCAAGCRDQAPRTDVDPLAAALVRTRPGARIPLDGLFVDQDGRSVSLRRLAHGKPIVLAPVQHDCPNLCGFTLEGLGTAIDNQRFKPGADFVVIALGIDPRETPAQASKSVRAFGRRGVSALVGKADAVDAVTRALGYQYRWDDQLGQYAHLAAVAVISPDGRVSRWLSGLSPRPDDLQLALTDVGRGRTGDLGDQLRLLCYHYDPEQGRYTAGVTAALRWMSAFTAAGLLCLIGFHLVGRRTQ